jgi:hypothetical protein
MSQPITKHGGFGKQQVGVVCLAYHRGSLLDNSRKIFLPPYRKEEKIKGIGLLSPHYFFL